jgi:methylmalonyl-CoA/ethylmalonyl-CoA epimerase
MDKADFKLARISTVMLGVRDFARSVAFYREKLGLTLQFEIPGFAFFDAGGVTLCLSKPLARALAESSSKVAGATEVVFAVEDVQSAYNSLLAKGIVFFREPHNVTASQWAANFEDPDGHNLSIFGPRDET